MGSAGLVALNQTVAVRLCQPLCNSHDSGKHSPVAQPLAILATLFDRIGRHGPAATIAGFALSPGTAQAISPRPGNATSSCLRSPYRNHARPRWLGPHRTGRSAGCALARCRDYHHTTNPCRQRAPLPRPQAESFVDGAWNLLGLGRRASRGSAAARLWAATSHRMAATSAVSTVSRKRMRQAKGWFSTEPSHASMARPIPSAG
jgi:hypothetical protein